MGTKSDQPSDPSDAPNAPALRRLTRGVNQDGGWAPTGAIKTTLDAGEGAPGLGVGIVRERTVTLATTLLSGVELMPA